MKTIYRIENISDEFSRNKYYLTYLVTKYWLFGLFSKDYWITVPIPTDGRALGCKPTIEKDCLITPNYIELKDFVLEYPNIEPYMLNDYLPKLDELVNKWAEMKANDEDEFDEVISTMGIQW